ncbi:DUF2085 domain-containing protein [Candidatus Micrarchaeota archaeon]|nr:DUF2085 domain-containing protein [Candidatus Micrarchaeota archaeon]
MSTVAPPLLAIYGINSASQVIYASDSTMCHQLPQRSFCVFTGNYGVRFGNCINDNNETLAGRDVFSGRPHMIVSPSEVGYAFGQCARNTSIYFFMLFGAIIFPIFRKTDSKNVPSLIWLILAITPIGIDGTTQLIANIIDWHYYWLSFIGLHESTNVLRVITGGIAGFAVSFYAIPILNAIGTGPVLRKSRE